MKMLIILSLSLLMTITIFGQSQFLLGKQSIISPIAQMDYQENTKMYAVGLAYTLKGRVDIGMNLKYGTMANLGRYKNIEISGYSPFISATLIKESNRGAPVSLYAGLELDMHHMSNRALATTGKFQSNDRILLAKGGLTKQLFLDNGIALYPSIQVEYGMKQVNPTIENDDSKEIFLEKSSVLSTSSSSKILSTTVSLPFSMGNQMYNQLVLSPAVNLAMNRSPIVSFKVAYLLDTKGGAKCRGGMCPTFN